MSQAELGEKMGGLSSQSVAQWESETGTVPLKKRIPQLEDVLGVEFAAEGEIPVFHGETSENQGILTAGMMTGKHKPHRPAAEGLCLMLIRVSRLNDEQLHLLDIFLDAIERR